MSRLGTSFYSLHRETYSVTAHQGEPQPGSGFYSLHRETYSVTEQRDRRGRTARRGFYSLHRETYSVTDLQPLATAARLVVSIRCIARRTA